jgi:hypothetical protein
MGCAALLVFLLASDPGAKTSPDADAAPRLQVAKLDVRDDTPAARDLIAVRRIYVDVLTGGEAAARLRDMLMASLQKTQLFIVTENQDRADAVLKGAADDKVFTDHFRSSDNLNMHAQSSASDHSSESRFYTEGESHSAGIGIGESESSNIDERKHEAVAAVRLVNREGDVIWSATEESLGGKFLGASADVADKIARQITADYRRLQTTPPDKDKNGSATAR